MEDFGINCPNSDCRYKPTVDEIAARLSKSGRMQCPECFTQYYLSPLQLKGRQPAIKVKVYFRSDTEVTQ